MTTNHHGNRGATVPATCSRLELAEREPELHEQARAAK
jgi:hypothetical protein